SEIIGLIFFLKYHPIVMWRLDLMGIGYWRYKNTKTIAVVQKKLVLLFSKELAKEEVRNSQTQTMF
ncbi:hypothetical protein, partial [Escherichia coli]